MAKQRKHLKKIEITAGSHEKNTETTTTHPDREG